MILYEKDNKQNANTEGSVSMAFFFFEGSVNLIRDWLSDNRIICLVIRGELILLFGP